MYTEGVFVQVEHSTFGTAKGSGVKINNIIITHSSILAPLCCVADVGDNIIEQGSSILRELKFNSNSCSDVIKFKVLHKNRPKPNVLMDQYINYSTFKYFEEDFTLEEAQLLMLYTYRGIFEVLKYISNWDAYGDFHDENQIQELNNLLLPKFIFLSVGPFSKELAFNSLQTIFRELKTGMLYPGLPVVVETTPFGNFSLFNSWSQGIISKIIGDFSDGILIDARLVTGCEGGPIYTFENGVKGNLIGVVIQTISWCNGEYVGFSLGLSLRHLLKEVLGLQQTVDYIPFIKSLGPLTTSTANFDHLTSSLVFVGCRHKWGSGVVINEDEGLILTCSHIINHDHNAVTVLCEGGKRHASVLYASPLNKPYDLALLSVGNVPNLKQLKMAETPPILGERVLAAGYPLSTESLVTYDRTPTLSMGCVSKTSRRGGPLQTTCCTQSGLSGGALIRPPNQLLGVVVSNLSLDDAVMPSFGFAVSVENFRIPIMKYITTKDPAYLQALSQGSCAVKMEWSLVDCKL